MSEWDSNIVTKRIILNYLVLGMNIQLPAMTAEVEKVKEMLSTIQILPKPPQSSQ